ncbi:MAG: ABC transporter permease [Clostridiales bacterium]|jgi:putative ABC transport system permease protein|nr:ABC transporter permease [Clostridiales bacterium]
MGVIISVYGGIGQGLLWAVLGIGVYLTFRILDFPDLTAEGTVSLGCAVGLQFINEDISPLIATLLAALIGIFAGLCTGLLHTKLKIPAVLSGILTMIALYSINIRIMNGGTSVSIQSSQSILAPLKNAFMDMGMERQIATHTSTAVVGLTACALVIALLYWFFGTQVGAAMRATGSNERMCRAQGIDTDSMKILTLCLSNGLIAMAGALVAQHMSYGGTNVGTGSIVMGLAAIILGEAFMGKRSPFYVKLALVALGSVLYYIIITLIIFYGLLLPTDTKLITAAMVVLAISLPRFRRLARIALDRLGFGKADKKEKFMMEPQLRANQKIEFKR